MKVQFTTKDVQSVLKMASRIVTGQSALPILSHILIEAEGDIQIKATDLNTGISALVSGEIIEPGSITTPARMLSDIVNDLPGKEFVFSTLASDRVEIKSGNATFRLAGLSADEFPELPEIGDDFFAINARDLRHLIQKTSFAVSTDAARPVLTGINLTNDADRLIAVATDGKRLALAKTTIPYASNVIVPIKAAKTVIGVFAKDEEIKVCVSGNQIIFAGDDITLNSRLIEGEFVNYKNLLEPLANNKLETLFNTESLIGAIRRISLLSNPQYPHIIMDIKDDSMTIHASTPELGNAEEIMDITSNGDIIIAFNAKFALDALANIDTDTVLFKFKDPLSPALVHSPDRDDYQCVLMPMRV